MNYLRGKRIGFIGAGNMCEALARGIMKAGVQSKSIIASDVMEVRRRYFQQKLGTKATSSNAEVIIQSDVIIFSVKPQVMGPVLEALRSVGERQLEKKVFISICAGVPTFVIERGLACSVRVIRCMPNTPMLVGLGAAALAKGKYANERDLSIAQAIFKSAAKVVIVADEEQLNAVTALSGSGPAYFFYLVEAMAEAGKKMGLDDDTALELAKQTAYGSGKLVATNDRSPTELRKMVTSKGGTTHAAITHMDRYHMNDIIKRAIYSAEERSVELGKMWIKPDEHLRSKL